MVVQRNGSEFHASELPAGRVAVMFTADWCGYCDRFYAHYKAIREGYVIDISDDEDPLWDTYRIRVVPTVILFEDGIPTSKRWAGVLGRDAATEIQAALSRDPSSSATA